MENNNIMHSSHLSRFLHRRTYEPVPDIQVEHDTAPSDHIITWRRAVALLILIVGAFALMIAAGFSWKDHTDDTSSTLPVTTMLGGHRPPATAATMVPLIWDEQNEATIEFCHAAHGQVYGYRLPGENGCGAAGLVIRVRPGEDYTLVLHNTAKKNATNIHTHGLHIGGNGDGDDITRWVQPGMCLKYKWSIPEDHMGGTHWLHSHADGMTNEQVSGGAFAMLIVEEPENVLNSVEEASFEEKERIRQWMNNDLLLVAAYANSAYSGNGKKQATIDMVADEWYRLRVLTVQPNGRRIPIAFPQECQVHPAAWDGTWRFEAPKRQVERYFNPTGAGRIDLAIRCPVGELPILFGADDAPVAILNVVAGDVSEATPFLPGNEPWQSYRPYHLRDLSDGDLAIGDFDEFTIFLTGLTVSGYSWDEKTPFMEVEYNTLMEWTIQRSYKHPFHIHVFHGQTFDCDGHEDGEYYDTISATNSECRVRFHVVDFGDRIVCHCHNIGHEDQGMMVWFQVNNGPLQSDKNREEVICPSTYHGHQ